MFDADLILCLADVNYFCLLCYVSQRGTRIGTRIFDTRLFSRKSTITR